jgi:hypothetical protein
MKRTTWLLAALAVALIAVNVWRWWPAPASAPKRSAGPQSRTPVFAASDFRLTIGTDTSAAGSRMARDLFQARVAPPPPAARVARPAPPPAPPVPQAVSAEPPPKSAEELAAESAQMELAQIKLVGVVFRGGKGQAFLVKGEHAYIAQAGEKVGARFRVESVHAESVDLHDPQTRVSAHIAVSGK